MTTDGRSDDVPLIAVGLPDQLRGSGAGSPVSELFDVVACSAECLLRTVFSDLRQPKSTSTADGYLVASYAFSFVYYLYLIILICYILVHFK